MGIRVQHYADPIITGAAAYAAGSGEAAERRQRAELERLSQDAKFYAGLAAQDRARRQDRVFTAQQRQQQFSDTVALRGFDATQEQTRDLRDFGQQKELGDIQHEHRVAEQREREQMEREGFEYRWTTQQKLQLATINNEDQLLEQEWNGGQGRLKPGEYAVLKDQLRAKRMGVKPLPVPRDLDRKPIKDAANEAIFFDPDLNVYKIRNPDGSFKVQESQRIRADGVVAAAEIRAGAAANTVAAKAEQKRQDALLKLHGESFKAMTIDSKGSSVPLDEAGRQRYVQEGMKLLLGNAAPAPSAAGQPMTPAMSPPAPVDVAPPPPPPEDGWSLDRLNPIKPIAEAVRRATRSKHKDGLPIVYGPEDVEALPPNALFLDEQGRRWVKQ